MPPAPGADQAAAADAAADDRRHAGDGRSLAKLPTRLLSKLQTGSQIWRRRLGEQQLAVAAAGLVAAGLGAGGVIPFAAAIVVMFAAGVLLLLCQSPSYKGNGRVRLPANDPAGAPREVPERAPREDQARTLDEEVSARVVESAAPAPVSEPGWRAVIDALVDPAVALDTEDLVVHFNPVSVDFFSQLRLGLPISLISRSPDLSSGLERARSGDDRIVAELLDRVPVERRLSAFISRLPGAADAPGTPQLLVVFRDITDQEKLAQMRADFIANASHELRTPLASLKGFVETLQGPALNDEVARERFLSMMATQATRMARLIDDLLALSRAELRVHLMPKGTVDVGELLEDVVETLASMAESNEIQLLFAQPGQPMLVRGERDELMQAFLNLVQNAIKYGKPGGHVELLIVRNAGLGVGRASIAISVIDDGPGIAQQHLPRLTERFYRVNVAHSREKGGTGLGLAIVKHIVTRHRGELKITSDVGKGSNFTVELIDVAPDATKKSIYQ